MAKLSSRNAFREYRAQAQRQKEKKETNGPDGVDKKSGKSDRSFWRLFLAFWDLLQGSQWAVVLALSTLTVSTILGLLPPLATKLAIDSVLTQPPQPSPSFIPDSFEQLSPMSRLIFISSALIIVSLIKTVVHLWGRWIATRTVNQVQVKIRRLAYQHILYLPLHRIHALKSGGATSMLRDDAGGVGDLIFNMLYNPWQAIVQLIGSLIILILVDWRLLLAGLLLLPVVYFTHRTWIYSVRPLFRDVRNQRQRIDGASTETFGGIRVVRTFAREFTETKRFVLSNHLLVRQQLMVWWRTRLIEIIWEVIIPMSSMALLLYGGWQILQGQLTIGDLMMFLIYLTMLLGPIATLAGSAVQFQNNLAGLDRILDLLAQSRELADRPNATRLVKASVQPRLTLENVGFHYPDHDRWVLRGIDIEIPAGQTVALVGRSGAGKTTLCNLVARFYDPSEGRILLNGQDLRDIQLRSYRGLLGIVEQDVFLFDGTVLENLAYGRRGARRDEIEQAAHMAAADPFIAELPHGYDTMIGERGVKLSGGQRQRLAIARAILADPKILILDEATSNLDSENEQLIQQSLNQLFQQRTSIIIAHRLSTIMRADQILVLDNGGVLERGTHAELMKTSGAYAKMVNLQTADISWIRKEPV
jgi:ATP-binding cassette, subfamily B, bacterial